MLISDYGLLLLPLDHVVQGPGVSGPFWYILSMFFVTSQASMLEIHAVRRPLNSCLKSHVKRSCHTIHICGHTYISVCDKSTRPSVGCVGWRDRCMSTLQHLAMSYETRTPRFRFSKLCIIEQQWSSPFVNCTRIYIYPFQFVDANMGARMLLMARAMPFARLYGGARLAW